MACSISVGHLSQTTSAHIRSNIEQARQARPNDHIRAWRLIEQTIREVSSWAPRLPVSIEHLANDVASASSSLGSVDSADVPDGAKQIGSTFLRLFDTLPVYDAVPQSDIKRWTELLSARRMAASMLDGREIRSVRLRSEVVKLRRADLKTGTT